MEFLAIELLSSLTSGAVATLSKAALYLCETRRITTMNQVG